MKRHRQGNPSHDKVGAVKFTSVSAGYLRALGMQLIKDRWMSNGEPNRVVLVNETFARSLFGARNLRSRCVTSNDALRRTM